MIKTRIKRDYSFSAAHKLDMLFLPGHQCANLHGHSYAAQVIVEYRQPDAYENEPVVLDFGELDRLVNPIIKQLDHTYLNDLLPIPTAEQIALFILKAISKMLPDQLRLASVEVWESGRSSAEVINVQD
jgi:6-pyruvoyltetrahydropterin/6-carboxytetrahydropterin synthase